MVKLKEKNNNLLSNLQKRLINKKNQNVEYKKHVFDTEIDRSKNESNMKIEKLKLQQEETSADLQVQMEELKAQPVKNALAKLKNQNDYNNVMNEVKKREITTLTNHSKLLGWISLLCSVFSGVMTSVSVLKDGLNIYTVTESILLIFGAIVSNIVLKNINKYYYDFYEKNDKSKALTMTLLLFGTIIYISYSIKTNYQFWDNTKIDSYGKFIISFIYDLFAVACAFVSDDYFYLNFNIKKQEETEEEIDVNSIIFNAKFGTVAGGQPKQNGGQ